jgi:hypothetical protein
VRYVFPRLGEEQKAVSQARAKAADKQLGRVVFSSDSDG